MDEQRSDKLDHLSDRDLFPLDNSQRLILQKMARMAPGNVLAVNGPPGSGKTAMLKAVIAHQWVEAAYLGKPCPITVAIGPTNQSVTNIIGAFPKVPYNGTGNPAQSLLHYKRWIPCPDTYGTYFPSSSELKK